jgi:hypothetical protein
MSRRRILVWHARRFAASLILVQCATCASASGGEEQAEFGYEYATWLGTGGYQVGGRDVFILRLPFHKSLRQSSEELFGINLLLPVSVGSLDTGTLVSEDLQTLTFIPGAELDFQMTPRWHLKPFAQVGLGKDFSNGDMAYIGAGGIKSRYSLQHGDYTLSLGNALVLAGSRADGGGDASSFMRFDAGIDVSQPVEWTLIGRRMHLGAFYIASFFTDNAEILRPVIGPDEIGMVHTFGVALGAERPLRILGLNLDQIGLSYVSGEGLRGIRLNTGFPF